MVIVFILKKFKSTAFFFLALYFATNIKCSRAYQNVNQWTPNIANSFISNVIRPMKRATSIERHHPHVIPPMNSSGGERLSNMTLRQFLSHPDGFHLGLAPAFFGFYNYFGALAAFHDNVLSKEEKEKGRMLLPIGLKKRENWRRHRYRHGEPQILLKSVAGASAGAMAAVLLASGSDPRESAEFASSITLENFNDFPGIGGILKGDLFEAIMVNKLKESKLEEALIPVAVTAYDLREGKGKILKRGCMGKATRASAAFPGLFQPCKWQDNIDSRYDLIDGGLKDPHGLVGLKDLGRQGEKKRIVNLCARSYSSSPIGPSQLPTGLNAAEMVSISIENSPQCGPWSMENGPRAVEASMQAMNEVLDVPMYKGAEDKHFILRVDAKAFIPKK